MAAKPIVDWNAVSWDKAERHVFRLQKRIYRASARGNVQAVHNLQRLLVKSESAKLLAVRRVTQDNRGKRTAGIDGVASVTPAGRLKMVKSLNCQNGTKAKPVRRVLIPKRNNKGQRPLGIPTMLDRAKQALVKLALEPQWEARFEPNSYGFRPGRSAHDAIAAVFENTKAKTKFVLDADIKGCFDNIDHNTLLAKLDSTPAIRRACKAWLKAGAMCGSVYEATDSGTPQGGVISPLLANIALHGLEEAIRQSWSEKTGKPTSGPVTKSHMGPALVRYADDFIILSHHEGGVHQAKAVAEQWLSRLGLQLNPEKTRIVHTLNECQGSKPGFDFLGFHIRQYPCGKHHDATVSGGRGHQEPIHRGFKLLITPSNDAQKRHVKELGDSIRHNRAVSQEQLISLLNPKVRGWSNYYRTVVSTRVFSAMDHRTYSGLRRWARRRHPNKNAKFVVKRYWKQVGKRRWAFGPKTGATLVQHIDTKIQRHIKVQGSRSPFDGDFTYWGQRIANYPEITKQQSLLLKKQQGRCTGCGLALRPGDVWEVDHIFPKSLGENGKLENLQLLHGHCHDRKTVQDGSLKRCS